MAQDDTPGSPETNTDEPTAAKAGLGDGTAPETTPETTPEAEATLRAKLAQVRSHLCVSLGHVVMAMIGLQRYRHQSVMDLQALVIEPLLRDRIAMAYAPVPGGETSEARELAGLAIWASVSEEVDAKIREQIKAGVFPVKLKPEDWTSGDIAWLLDVLASDRKTTGAVLSNFRQVVKDGALRLHPIVPRMIDKDLLDRLQRQSVDDGDDAARPAAPAQSG
jgi:hemolysin-activating ACP:hemolysin acyltransferase